MRYPLPPLPFYATLSTPPTRPPPSRAPHSRGPCAVSLYPFDVRPIIAPNAAPPRMMRTKKTQKETHRHLAPPDSVRTPHRPQQNLPVHEVWFDGFRRMDFRTSNVEGGRVPISKVAPFWVPVPILLSRPARSTVLFGAVGVPELPWAADMSSFDVSERGLCIILSDLVDCRRPCVQVGFRERVWVSHRFHYRTHVRKAHVREVRGGREQRERLARGGWFERSQDTMGAMAIDAHAPMTPTCNAGRNVPRCLFSPPRLLPHRSGSPSSFHWSPRCSSTSPLRLSPRISTLWSAVACVSVWSSSNCSAIYPKKAKPILLIGLTTHTG